MVAKTATRGRKSKTEIQSEFQQIKEDLVHEKSDSNAKAEELLKLKQAEIREAIKDVSVDGIVQKLANMGIDVSRALSDLSAKLVEQVELLSSLREAVLLEQKELARLHKIDIAKTALDQLVEEYDMAKKELEAEINLRRAQWEKEQEEQEKENRELEDSLKKQRQREKEEYEYQKLTERKKEQDKYSEDQRLLERKNKEKQETLEKSWAEREAELKTREDEFNRLKKEVESFPERLKQDITKAVAETSQRLEAKQKQDLIITQKDMESERRLADLKIKSLEDTVSRQFAQIESLQERLEEAKKQVQDIAVKAIEGASGAKALNHINQIAMEQAKTRTPQV